MTSATEFLRSPEGAKDLIENMKGFAVDVWQREGAVEPMAAIYATKQPQTGEPIEGFGVILVPGIFRGEDSKDEFSEVVRSLCFRGDAIAIGFLVESYQRRLDKHSTESPDEMTARHHREMAANGGTMKGLPGVIEAVMVTWEHCSYKGAKLWMAEITREIPGDESSPGTLGEWEEMLGEGASMTGRMTNFLPGSGGN